MTLLTIFDMEAIVADRLRVQAEIIALGARVGAEVPANTTGPWVRITQIDASDYPQAPYEHFIEYVVQLDSFAGQTATLEHRGQEEANDLSRAVRATMKQMKLDDFGPGGPEITCVRFRQHARLPDTSYEPPRQRYMLEALVYAHPKAA